MRRLLFAALAIVALAACPAHKASASPPGVTLTVNGLALHSGGLFAPDTVVVSATCPAAGPNTQCVFSGTESVSGSTIASGVAVNVGSPFTTAFVCTAPGTHVNIVLTVIGRALGFTDSPSSPVSGNGNIDCPAKSASNPGSTFTVILKAGG